MANDVLKNMSNEELFQTSLLNLKQAVLQQSRTQRRVASRVRTLIRAVMVGLVTALVFILYLVFILTQQVNALSNSLDTITTQAVSVQESMDDIEMVMITFETYMNELPGMDVSVTGIEYSIHGMTNNFSRITQNVSTITTEINTLNKTLSGVGQNTLVLNQILKQITADIADGTKPIKRFNQMNPFGFFR
ncbi:MAG: hypothetical protein KAG34_06115 [Cocleimonas sp.]|nr:hypothetical protein [Cocleimonas sp.]